MKVWLTLILLWTAAVNDAVGAGDITPNGKLYHHTCTTI
jgi:hypothetical protein